MPERVPNEIIANEVRSAWRTCDYQSSLFGRTVRELDREKGIEGIYVCEHASADVENVCCTGSPVVAWLFDGDSFETSAAPEIVGQASAIYSSKPVLSYCHRADENDYVVVWYSGPRAGFGTRCRLVREQGAQRLEPFGIGWHS